MSELKVIHAYTFDEIEIISTNSNGNNYYLKSEADKLIAELNMRICEGDEDFEIANNQIKRLIKIVRQQKYKRCFAMVKLCATSAHYEKSLGSLKYFKWWLKWYERWMKLAEQFKEGE